MRAQYAIYAIIRWQARRPAQINNLHLCIAVGLLISLFVANSIAQLWTPSRVSANVTF